MIKNNSKFLEIIRLKQEIPDYSRGYYRFGNQDDYPDLTEKLTSEGLANACLSKYVEYLYGQGLLISENKEFENIDFEAICQSYATHGGYAVHVRYSANLKDVFYEVLDLKKVRISSSSDGYKFIFKKYGYSESILHVDKFTQDLKETKEQIKKSGGIENWAGQIFYYSNKKNSYPETIINAIRKPIASDLNSTDLTLNQIANNFSNKQAVFIEKPQNFEVAEENTKDKKTTPSVMKIKEDIEAMSGPDGDNIVIMEYALGGNKPEIVSFGEKTNDAVYKYTDEKVKSQILMGFMQPPALFFSSGGNIFNNNEIEDAMFMYNSATLKYRKEIQKSLQFLTQTDIFIKEKETINNVKQQSA